MAVDNRYLAFSFWKTDHNATFLGDLTEYVDAAELDFSPFRDIPVVATLRLRSDITLSMIADHIMPRVTTQEGAVQTTYPLGIYHLTWPREIHAPTHSMKEVTAYDMLVHLTDAKFDSVRTIDVGANPVTEAINICKEADVYGAAFDHFNIPATAATLVAGLTWEAGIEKLRAVTDLLNAAGYYKPWADALGYLTSRPYDDLASLTASASYVTDADSIVIDAPAEMETDATRFANKIIVVCNSPDLDVPIVATATNSNPSSPTSTVVLGRTITKVLTPNNIVDLATAQALADRELQEAASVYVKGTLQTRLDFDRVGKAHEAFNLQVSRNGDVLLDGKWWSKGWRMPLVVGGQMTHEIARVEAV